MWIAKFEGAHSSCTLAPLCKKHKVTDYVYLLNAWQDNEAFYYSEAHILEGEKQACDAFVKDLKKETTVQIMGNYLVTLDKRPLWMASYLPLWDKRLIQIKPVIQKTDGSEIWEIGAWSKEPLQEILTRLPKEFKIKLKYIREEEVDQLFLPHIMPKLTDKQKLVVQLAVHEGYYEFPRKVNLDDLAMKLQLSKSTVQQHLRTAEKKLMAFLVGNVK